MKSCFDANVQAIALSMIPNLYRDHPSTGIPFNFTYACRLLVTFKGGMLAITLHVQLFYTIMVIILAILIILLLSYQPSDLQRPPTYYYRYIALLSFRGSCLIALSFVFLRYFSMLNWVECSLAQHTLQDLHRILI